MDFLDKYDVHINNKELLLTALTHTSYAYEHQVPSYERLEFLGDAVLQLISSEYLYKMLYMSMLKKLAIFLIFVLGMVKKETLMKQ